MINQEKTIKDLTDAYLRFKSYVYHENFSIGLKKELAEFETKFNINIRKLAKEVEQLKLSGKSTVISTLIKGIDCLIIPKSFSEMEYNNQNGSFFTNKNTSDNYYIENIKQLIPFIKCDIRLHILNTYWVIKIGINYDKQLSNHSYANRLVDINSSNKNALFKKYFKNYNKWRDDAITKAKVLHEEGFDVAILNLDIQNYYHSVDLDLSKLKVSKSNKWLHDILIKIHVKYSNLLHQKKLLAIPNKRIIPIGLCSSNILANYYLHTLDQKIVQYVTPEFYGRYVDDFLIVFKNPSIGEEESSVVKDFIYDNIAIKTKSIEESYILKNDDNASFNVVINKNILQFQLKKVKLYYFRKEDSIDLLDEFKKEIERNSSEFRLELEEEELKNPFYNNLYRINYSDTINKLRSIDSFTHNKFGASKQITKVLNSVRYLNELKEDDLSNISSEINEYFLGKRGIELFSLWEKTISYFVITEDVDGLLEFCDVILRSIELINYNDSEDADNSNTITQKIKESLTNHFLNCFFVSAALNIPLFTGSFLLKVKKLADKKQQSVSLKKLTVLNLKNEVEKIIDANLLKHNLCFYPLLNYCKQRKSFKFSSSKITNRNDFEFEDSKIKLSPRHIQLHEIEIFYFMKYKIFKKNVDKEYLNDPIKFCNKIYVKINSLSSRINLKLHNIKNKSKANHNLLELKSTSNKNKLKIGLVNMKVSTENNKLSLKNTPKLSLERLNQINKVFNEAVKNNVDVIVFPEISIPFQWISKLSFYAKSNNLVIICGIEHFVIGKDVYNYVCTILPFNNDRFLFSHIDLRLKIDYSPGELLTIKEANKTFQQPSESKDEKLRIITWNGISFSVMNCFELTDIEKRASLRGLIDIIFAIEYNRDINYFSSIAESYSRDIHSYFVQVNSSDFGDSRITLPKETILKDNVRIKGGENVSLLVGEVDIEKLRFFQSQSIADQIKSKEFKPTPPNYKKLNNRI